MAESEPKAIPHDIRRTLIRRGIVVKSQDPGTQFCHITATADTVRHRPATLSGDGEQAIIDNGSITQVFFCSLTLSALPVSMLNCPTKRLLSPSNSTSVLAVALTIPFLLMLLRSSPVTFFSVNRPSLAIFPLPNP